MPKTYSLSEAQIDRLSEKIIELAEEKEWSAKLASKLEGILDYKVQVKSDITLRQQLLSVTTLLTEYNQYENCL